jgi:hypothetical protein
MKKDDKNKAPRKDKKPFFARLLEAQELEQVAGGGGGGGPQTRKFPSDKDESSGPIFTTQKFPSDNDEPGSGY